MQAYPKRLIEVDLPIKRISAHARREKFARQGHIQTLHIWWARRPLAACRAVLCASLWPDPADVLCPDSFRNTAKQLMSRWASEYLGKMSPDGYRRFIALQKNPDKLDQNDELREALLEFIADFANWDNSSDRGFLEIGRALTQAAHEALGGTPGSRPLVVDPFAGGGSIPLEALRIGADAFASDLNPLPVLLNQVVLEYIPKYGNALTDQVVQSADTVRTALEQKLRSFYFTVPSNENRHVFFWARTITCEGPACGYQFPLLRSLWLRQKSTKSAALSLKKNTTSREVDVAVINPITASEVGRGTSRQGAATCPICDYTTPVERVREQLSLKQGGTVEAKLLAVGVTRPSEVGKRYRLPTLDEMDQFAGAKQAYLEERTKTDGGVPTIPTDELNHLRGFFNVVLYGMRRWGDLFSPRQALLMTTLTSLIKEEHARLAKHDIELADAVATCLALITGKVAQYNSSCCRWKPTGETLVDMFGRQAIPMVWDFAEAYPFSNSTGDFGQYAESFSAVLRNLTGLVGIVGTVQQCSATAHPLPDDSVDAFVTDPPYYDAIPYADLSDFFYVWLRRMLGSVHPQILSGPLSPKTDECVTLAHRAAMYRHKDRQFFERMMTIATAEGRRYTKSGGIGVVVFANKSTSGWEAMLTALIDSGWVVSASWPIDTEMSSRLRAQDSAVLASSVHLVCRPRKNPDGSERTGEIGDWRDVLQELPRRIHEWMPRLNKENVVGADAIFACLGPALEIFSRYSRVEKANGEVVALKEYLEQVWAAVAKEALTMIFAGADTSGFEEDARLTAMWLWTVNAGNNDANGDSADENDAEAEGEPESGTKKPKLTGFVLEYDAARKIAQGLGAHLEDLSSLVEVSGETARLLPVAERAQHLFGNDQGNVAPVKKKKDVQPDLFKVLEQAGELESTFGDPIAEHKGKTVLDQIHQSMILFAAGRSAALKRFLVEEGIGRDARFWSLAQALSALYPTSTTEKRWVDGVLARKKGLGF